MCTGNVLRKNLWGPPSLSCTGSTRGTEAPHTLGVTPTTGSSSPQSGPTVHVPFVWLRLRAAPRCLSSGPF